MACFKAVKRHPREGGIQNSTSIFMDILQELGHDMASADFLSLLPNISM
jgi:hypothetical protein